MDFFQKMGRVWYKAHLLVVPFVKTSDAKDPLRFLFSCHVGGPKWRVMTEDIVCFCPNNDCFRLQDGFVSYLAHHSDSDNLLSTFLFGIHSTSPNWVSCFCWVPPIELVLWENPSPNLQSIAFPACT